MDSDALPFLAGLAAAARRITTDSPLPATSFGGGGRAPSIRRSVHVNDHPKRRGRRFTTRNGAKKGRWTQTGDLALVDLTKHKPGNLARVSTGCIQDVALQLRRHSSCSSRSRIHAEVVSSDGSGRVPCGEKHSTMRATAFSVVHVVPSRARGRSCRV